MGKCPKTMFFSTFGKMTHPKPPPLRTIGGGCVFQQLTDHWNISDPQTNLLSTLVGGKFFPSLNNWHIDLNFLAYEFDIAWDHSIMRRKIGTISNYNLQWSWNLFKLLWCIYLSSFDTSNSSKGWNHVLNSTNYVKIVY